MNARLSRAVPVVLVAAFCIGAGHPHAPAARSDATAKAAVRLNTAQAQQARQQRILTLTQAIPTRLQATENQGGITAPAPRKPPERLRPNQDAGQGQDNGVDRNDSIANQIPSEVVDAQAAGVLAVGPVSDAVAHICGRNVTVCGVWWPTAVTDSAQYQNCVRQTSSNDLDFGASPAEYCSALYTGDCEGAAPGSDIYDLCSLVPGVAAQWTSQYGFSKFVTHGDCGYYKSVDVREHNVFGFQLQQPDTPDQPAASPAHKPALKICTGRLYLKILQ